MDDFICNPPYTQWCRKTFFGANTKTGIIAKLWEICTQH